MKVLIVNTSDIYGGAARAAYRLHKALLEEDVDSQMLVQNKSSNDHTVIGPKSKIHKLIGKIRPILDVYPLRRYKNRGKMLFSPSWLPFSNVVNQINEINPDIVHLNWITGGMIRIEDLTKINVPIVWSLHDMWAFTDGYHYDPAFDIHKYGLADEPKLSIQSKIFQRKSKTYQKINQITVIGLSKWLNKCSQQSLLLGDKPHIYLPNLINTVTYSPFDKFYARKLFNLPTNKKLILFGAMSATSDPRKGFSELKNALSHVPSEYELIIFGSNEPKDPHNFKQKTYYLGHLYDDISLRVLYSAADVMVVPSLMEAFGQTASESMACGTPVVSFATTGLLDIVDHKINGYLARPFDSFDLAKGIIWVLNKTDDKNLTIKARNKIIDCFDSKKVVKEYLKLYNNIIN